MLFSAISVHINIHKFLFLLNTNHPNQIALLIKLRLACSHLRTILKKIVLASHDFAENFYLIWFVNCETIEINLRNAIKFP